MGILESIGIDTVDVNIGPIADYEVIRSKEIDKDMSAIINIGSETTTVSLFNKGIIINSEILKIGGQNIDNDISYVFKISNDDSNKVKEQFASAHKKFASINEVTEMLTINRDLVKINQYDLSQVVMSRMEEILELAKKQLFLLTNKEIKYIIITGGSSELPQMQYLVDEIFEDNAYVNIIEDIGIRNNKYSTAAGLIKGFDQKLKMRDKVYSMFSMDKQEDISIPKRKGIGEDSILGKVFGIFFD
jgi:cell division protein FtsA